MSSRRALASVMAALGDLGFLAAVAAAFTGMRELMVTSGGYCASGGPYVIASVHQCSASETDYLLFGLLGALVFASVALAATAWAGWSTYGTAMSFWAIGFGALGWNFMSLGFSPPHGQGGGAGWIVCGFVFWGLAAGGLVPVILTVVAWLRRGGGPEPTATFTAEPLVRAVVPRD
jgi:hypothetical protein